MNNKVSLISTRCIGIGEPSEMPDYEAFHVIHTTTGAWLYVRETGCWVAPGVPAYRRFTRAASLPEWWEKVGKVAALPLPASVLNGVIAGSYAD